MWSSFPQLEGSVFGIRKLYLFGAPYEGLLSENVRERRYTTPPTGQLSPSRLSSNHNSPSPHMGGCVRCNYGRGSCWRSEGLWCVGIRQGRGSGRECRRKGYQPYLASVHHVHSRFPALRMVMSRFQQNVIYPRAWPWAHQLPGRSPWRLTWSPIIVRRQGAVGLALWGAFSQDANAKGGEYSPFGTCFSPKQRLRGGEVGPNGGRKFPFQFAAAS